MKKLIYIVMAIAGLAFATAGWGSTAAGNAPELLPIASEDSAMAAEEAEYPVREAFMLIPDKDLDLLMPQMREEMLIYMAADSIYKCRNIYTGLSWIEAMTPDYLRVHLTDVSTLQLRVLPAAKKNLKKGMRAQDLVMSIYTIAGESDTADSTIKFYSLTDWGNDSTALTSLPAKKYFALPAPEDFYDKEKVKAAGLKLGDLMEEMPFHTMAYEITESDPAILTGRLTIDNYLTREQRERIEPYLRKTLRWRWDGSRFRPE